jgi:dienelactone hydrolase
MLLMRPEPTSLSDGMARKIPLKTDIARSGTQPYGSSMVSERITVTPGRPALDTELRIHVGGLPPGRQVTLHAASADTAGQFWRADATFVADRGGIVDLGRDVPVRGSYQDADAMGLVWSMEPTGSRDPALTRDKLAPVPLRLTAEVDGTRFGWAEVWRSVIPDGLVRTRVQAGGLVGVLFHPDDGAGNWPGVMQLGGSEGGLHEDDAALLAASGFTVLALAYYGMPGLPPTLKDIPVEYFGKALDYLRAHPRVAPGGIAVMGVSKGGEAALLTGATYPGAVRSVISIVGSAVLTQGISQSVTGGSLLEILGTPVASWTYRGEELPYLPNVVTAKLMEAMAAGGPVCLGWAAPDLGASDAERAGIAVERIAGPVLLISGEDDLTYGVAFQEAAMRRLARTGHRYPYRHVVHERAGHLIAASPYRPTTRNVLPGPGVDFMYGGTAVADAAARVATWGEIRAFLDEAGNA